MTRASEHGFSRAGNRLEIGRGCLFLSFKVSSIIDSKVSSIIDSKVSSIIDFKVSSLIDFKKTF